MMKAHMLLIQIHSLSPIVASLSLSLSSPADAHTFFTKLYESKLQIKAFF